MNFVIALAAIISLLFYSAGKSLKRNAVTKYDLVHAFGTSMLGLGGGFITLLFAIAYIFGIR